MRVPNALLRDYLELLTDLSQERIAGLLGNPLEAKFALADAVVAGYHGVDAARGSRAEYDRVHQQGGLPDVLPEWRPGPEVRRDERGNIALPTALHLSGLASSSSDARRLIEGKGVRVDGVIVVDVKAGYGPGSYVVQVGKSKAARWTLPS